MWPELVLTHVTESGFDPCDGIQFWSINETVSIKKQRLKGFLRRVDQKYFSQKLKVDQKLRTFLKEKETINFENVHSSIRKRTNYKSPKMKKVINFIVPLSGR